MRQPPDEIRLRYRTLFSRGWTSNFLYRYYAKKVVGYFGRTGLMYLGDSFVGFKIRPGERDEVIHFLDPVEMIDWKAWRWLWKHRKEFKEGA